MTDPAVTEAVVLRNLVDHLERLAPERRVAAVRSEAERAPSMFAGDVWDACRRVLARAERGEDALGAARAELAAVTAGGDQA